MSSRNDGKKLPNLRNCFFFKKKKTIQKEDGKKKTNFQQLQRFLGGFLMFLLCFNFFPGIPGRPEIFFKLDVPPGCGGGSFGLTLPGQTVNEGS